MVVRDTGRGVSEFRTSVQRDRHIRARSGRLVFNFTALELLNGSGYLSVFEPGQLNALVLLLFETHANGLIVWGTFFSLHCFVLGWLIFKSGYFPRILGILMVIAAAGYLVDSFGNMLSVGYEARFTWIVYVTAFGGEFPFFVWLLIKGVKKST